MEKYELSSEEIGTIEHVIDDHASSLNEQMNNELPWSSEKEKIEVFQMVHDFNNIGERLRFKSINPILKELLERLRKVDMEGPGFIIDE